MKPVIPVGASVPMAKRASWFRAGVAVQDRLMTASPRTGLRCAGAAARAVRLLGLYGDDAKSVQEVLPWLGEDEAREIARRAVESDFRNRALNRLVIAGRFDLVAPFVDASGLQEIRALSEGGKAAVLGVMHIGPIAATSVALHTLGVPAFLVRTGAGLPPPPGLEVGSLEGPHMPAMILRRALDRLRAGRIVVMGLDRRSGQETGRVPCLGRGIRLRRGAFMLARLAGVPLIPVVTRWTHGGYAMEVEAQPPLAIKDGRGEGSEVEDRLAADVAHWLEGYVRSHPEEVSLQLLHLLGTSPRV